MDDVPGHPSTFHRVLARSDMRYLVTGQHFLGTATSLAPGKVPFYGNLLTAVASDLGESGVNAAVSRSNDGLLLDPYSLDPYTARPPYEMFIPRR